MCETNKVKKMDIFNIVLGILNVILLTITIVYANKAIKSNENIALKSGSYDKGEIVISFGGFFIKPNEVYDVYYGFDTLSDSVLHLTGYPLGIHSKGKKTVENISVHFKYPHLMRMAVGDSLLEFSNNLINLERYFQTVEPYDQVLYKINSIDPGASLGVGDIFATTETTRLINVDAKTADDYDVSALVKYDFWCKTEVIITGKDIDALYYKFRLKFQQVSSLEELIVEVAPTIKENILSQKQNHNYFFVTMPTINESVETELGVINMSHSKEDNTVLCIFDKDLKTIRVRNQEGMEIRKIDIK